MIKKQLFYWTLAWSLMALAAVSATAEDEAPVASAKPYLVKVHADWCTSCAMLSLTWEKLVERHADDANIVILDVTDKEHTEKAAARAEELGIQEFYEANVGRTGTVGVLMPDGSPVEVFKGRLDHRDYTAAIESAKEKLAAQ